MSTALDTHDTQMSGKHTGVQNYKAESNGPAWVNTIAFPWAPILGSFLQLRKLWVTFGMHVHLMKIWSFKFLSDLAVLAMNTHRHFV